MFTLASADIFLYSRLCVQGEVHVYSIISGYILVFQILGTRRGTYVLHHQLIYPCILDSVYTERYMCTPTSADNWEGYDQADLTK